MSDHWPSVALHNFCRPKQWPTIPINEMSSQGYPVYGANGRIGFYRKYTHEERTLMITCRGATCGTLNISEPRSYITGNAMALDDLDDEVVDLKFVYYALARRGLEDAITGSAQPQITRQTLERVTIPLPPLSEQQRIAGILDKADALRRKRQQALQLTEQFLRSTFLDMFGSVVDLMSFDRPIRSDSSDCRPAWVRCTVGDQVTLQRGFDITQKLSRPGQVPVISSGGVSGYHDTAMADGPGVLLGRKGSVGSVHFVRTAYWPHDTTLWVKDFHGNSPVFVYYFFREFPIQRYEASTANPSLNRNNLHPIPVWWPSIAEQNRFARVHEHCALRTSSSQKLFLEQAESLFHSLVQRAFRGEL